MSSRVFGRGWLPDLPDFRDYTLGTKSMSDMYKKLKVEAISKVKVRYRMEGDKACLSVN